MSCVNKDVYKPLGLPGCRRYVHRIDLEAQPPGDLDLTESDQVVHLVSAVLTTS